MNIETIRAIAAERTEELLGFRHHLHAHPELSFHEFQTTEYIISILEKYGISYRRNPAGTGLVARIDGETQGPVIAFRTDLDALPVTEETGFPFASQNPGVMHACGHDMHMTSLIGLCLTFSSHRELIRGSVVFIFQPAEEVVPGGADGIIKAGLLEDVDYIYGFHIAPEYPTGTVGYVYGPAMACTTEFRITVKGRGGHGAAPHNTIDPIVCASQLVLAFQTIISRNVRPLDSALISCCSIHGGTTFNVIPDTVSLMGTIRTYSEDVRDLILRRMKEIFAGLGTAMDCEITPEFIYGYPALINHDRHTDLIKEAVEAAGYTAVRTDPTMIGEDFSYYMKYRPGAFFFLGVKDPAVSSCGALHTSVLKADEGAITVALEVYLNLYLKVLEHADDPFLKN